MTLGIETVKDVETLQAWLDSRPGPRRTEPLSEMEQFREIIAMEEPDEALRLWALGKDDSSFRNKIIVAQLYKYILKLGRRKRELTGEGPDERERNAISWLADNGISEELPVKADSTRKQLP